MSKTLAARFWAKVDKRGPTDCWPWLASLDGAGYGQISPGGRGRTPLKAHRVSVQLAGTSIPAGHLVHHRCDNRLCVNPAHLEVLSRAEHAEHHFLRCSRHGGDEMRRIQTGRNVGRTYCGACNREKAGNRRELERLRRRVAELEATA